MIRLKRIIEQNKESLFAVTNMLLLFSDSGKKTVKVFPVLGLQTILVLTFGENSLDCLFFIKSFQLIFYHVKGNLFRKLRRSLTFV